MIIEELISEITKTTERFDAVCKDLARVENQKRQLEYDLEKIERNLKLTFIREEKRPVDPRTKRSNKDYDNLVMKEYLEQDSTYMELKENLEKLEAQETICKYDFQRLRTRLANYRAIVRLLDGDL